MRFAPGTQFQYFGGIMSYAEKMNELDNKICMGCEADVIDLIFADDTGRCDFCGIPFSLLCRRCHSGKVRCEGHCNKVCCFRCFNKINRCVFDCEFTCVTYCTTTIFCYALGGHICGKCIHIHEEVCGCVAYNHIDSCINSNYDDGEDPRRLKSL